MEKYQILAEGLHKALTSDPIHCSHLINVVKTTNNLERQFIRENYFKMYRHELMEDLKSLRQIEGKSFECLMIGLFRSPTEFDSYEIYEAVDGVGTNEEILSEILATRESYKISEIKKFYEFIFSNKLEEVIEEEKLSKDYYNFILKLLENKRRNSISDVNNNNFEKELNNLCNMKIEKTKKMTNEKKADFLSKITLILTQENPLNLKQLKEAFQKKNSMSIEEFINKEFDNPIRAVLLYTLSGHIDYVEFYAKRLMNAMIGEKKDNKKIVRSMVSIYPINMVKFRKFIESEFKTNLDDLISKNTKGYFKELLLVVANNDNSPSIKVEFESI